MAQSDDLSSRTQRTGGQDAGKGGAACAAECSVCVWGNLRHSPSHLRTSAALLSALSLIQPRTDLSGPLNTCTRQLLRLLGCT